MFRIRDFSRFTRVSVRMLRHYDRLGLLEPAWVDPRSRYRWYSARQLSRLQRILALRDLGFSLEHVAEILEGDPRGRAFSRVLERRKLELEREVEEQRRRIAQIETRLVRLAAGADPPPDVVLRRVPAVTVAARRTRVADLDAAVEELFEGLEQEVARADARAAGPPVLVYHDGDGRSENADVEAAVPVMGSAVRIRGARVRALPPIAIAACTTYVGSYEQWWRVAEGLLGTLESRRLVPAGPVREVFVQFSARDASALGLPRAYLAERDEDFVTEMQLPVRPAAAAERSRRTAGISRTGRSRGAARRRATPSGSSNSRSR